MNKILGGEFLLCMPQRVGNSLAGFRVECGRRYMIGGVNGHFSNDLDLFQISNAPGANEQM
jgi:hypothetical protein